MYKTMFSLFLELLTKKKVSRLDLAEKLYISEKTVSRYISHLIADGVPIISMTGRGGGYELDGAYIATLKRF